MSVFQLIASQNADWLAYECCQSRLHHSLGRLLHPLRSISAGSNRFHPDIGPSHILVRHRSLLGGCHDRMQAIME